MLLTFLLFGHHRYKDLTNSKWRALRCTSADCSTRIQLPIPATNGVSRAADLAIHNGLPLIAGRSQNKKKGKTKKEKEMRGLN